MKATRHSRTWTPRPSSACSRRTTPKPCTTPASSKASAYPDEPRALAVAASMNHPLARRRDLTRAEVAAHQLLVAPPGCSFRMAADHVFGPDGPRTELDSITVVRAWAGHGLGIAVIPDFLLDTELAPAGLIRLDLAAEIPPLVLRLIWRSGRADDHRLRQVLYAASA
ncbi:substrate-binding domain-containing protein [Saccharopolyspora sp. 5N102]|uniref:substrate-binding domain-containing protein n=1 Tax=Saccharopolyspora sp. 5N102 TaxID=3375155 RepID=UPI0037951D3A